MAQAIPLAQITRNPKQPRETFPQEHIERLAASIQKRGLIQPITVRPIKRGNFRYEIVAGECRFRAHMLLGVKNIRAEIVEIDEAEMQLRAIVENLQRQDMNPIEEARAYQALIDQDYSPQKIVDELGLKSTAIVTQRLTLLNLTPEIQKLVASGNLAVTMAWGVAQVSPDRQAQLIRGIASGQFRTAEQVKHAGIALREAEAQIDAFENAPRASPRDLAALSRLESKIMSIADMVAAGFQDGECIAAQRVSAERVKKMADQLVLIRKHVLQMEHNLRRMATQTEIRFEAA
jgi:ParB family chromosome partitioning protein